MVVNKKKIEYSQFVYIREHFIHFNTVFMCFPRKSITFQQQKVYNITPVIDINLLYFNKYISFHFYFLYFSIVLWDFKFLIIVTIIIMLTFLNQAISLRLRSRKRGLSTAVRKRNIFSKNKNIYIHTVP